jgi:hypothetical protein
MLILWGVERRGQPNLPAALGRYRQYRRSFPAGELRVVAKITGGSGPMIRADVEWLDAADGLIARLEDAEFVGEAKLSAAFRNNVLPAALANGAPR